MKISSDQLAHQIESELGAGVVTTEPTTLISHAVDGKQPTLVCTPTTPDHVVVAMRICGSAQAAVIPWGGGTAMAVGNPPRRTDAVLKTVRLNRVIEHDHANLTVTVQSGITLDALQAALAPQKQFVPLDPPFPDRSTIGGTVAANLNGLRRSRYGGVRDVVIGMKVVLGTGEQIKAGGKVVKNVAGYDMCKLFTGSLGTLGIISEVTLRVAPIPESIATIVANGTMSQAVQLAGELADSKLLPAAVCLRNNVAEQSWRLAVCFEGFEETVARQLRDLSSMAQRMGMSSETLRAEDQRRVWQQLRDLPLHPDRVIYRVTVPRASVTQVIGAMQHWSAGAREATLLADLAMGSVWTAWDNNKLAAGHFARLTALAGQNRGHAVMFAAPPECKTGIEVWGPSPPTFSLMREIKQQFDPQGIINPGRFVGGL
ncbi:MAG: FAD-binding oxidoreductase [Candidatus Binatia bacterium]